LANFIQPNGKIIFMYGASTWNASWYPVWFPCNHRYDSAGYINVIDPTVYLKAKSPVTFTDQSAEYQYIFNSDGTRNTNFNSSNRYSFSVTAPLSTEYNVDADTYDMIGDWTSITTPPLDEWVLAFWDGNNNTWMNIGGSTEANSHIAVKWNTSSLDVKVMSGGGLDVNTGAGLYVTNPLPTSSSSDEGKVLTVNSSGTAEWGNASTVTVDQTYDASSANPQSGIAVAGAISGLSQVPPVTSSDNNKVLKASYSGGVGSYAWASESDDVEIVSSTLSASDAATAIATALNNNRFVLYRYNDGQGTQVDLPLVYYPSSNATTYTFAGWISDTRMFKRTLTYADNAWSWSALTKRTIPAYTAGNMISLANSAIAVSTTAGITDIQQVSALPANPVATVLYLIPET
jgi:hypothetical protein